MTLTAAEKREKAERRAKRAVANLRQLVAAHGRVQRAQGEARRLAGKLGEDIEVLEILDRRLELDGSTVRFETHETIAAYGFEEHIDVTEVE